MCFMKGGFMVENFMDTWAQALEILQEEISPVGYKTYVDVMVPRLVDESTLCFLSPSNYHIDICKKRYLDLIENTLTFLTKKSYQIMFEAKEIIPDSTQEDIQNIPNMNYKETTKEEIRETSRYNVKEDSSLNKRTNEKANLNPRYNWIK